ncbi:beta-eliminating lyase-related protein [Mesorhizobium ciceri]|uniref:beta-eliminating lyase-related protein n=1 Tax=Mesorhizobium TaxID=68287 RepID=UPI001FDA84BF|nr:beta-eliminating lyase-related protein [Mesorhizobium ciceri]
MPLHMDGACFANVLTTLACCPAEMTWKAGVDLLSFGATKNGTLGRCGRLVPQSSREHDRPSAKTGRPVESPIVQGVQRVL